MQIRQTQQQRLLLAPQVTLSLKILHLTNLELQPFLQQQVEENPLLELSEPLGEGSATAEGDADPRASQSSGSNEDWAPASSQEGSGTGSEEDPDQTDRAALEHWIAASISLNDLLRRQLSCLPIAEGPRRIAEALVGQLDEHGYLDVPLADFARERSLSEAEALEALRWVQHLEPAGIGARDLRECLLLQLEASHEAGTLAHRIVAEHFALFARNRPVALAKATHAPLSAVERACERIRRLNPKPGASLSGSLPQSIIPDLVVVRREDHYDVELNDQHVPRITLNRSYFRMLRNPATPPEVKAFLQDKFRQAGWVIRAIDERNATLLAIGRCLLSMQGDFLDKGLAALKPLTQAQVGSAIGRHPSTVSRAIAGKTIDTPMGIFKLEQLFATAVPQSQDGGVISDAAIKSEIAQLVEAEDPEHPLSDEAIVSRLKRRQVGVARRTVAKYRMTLKILPARMRRRRLD